MADQREVALNFIKTNGPVLPVQIAKVLETEVLFASAVLSELTATKRLKVSKRPIGGSPLYFIPGQENLLAEKLLAKLKAPEKEAYDLLEKEKLIWEGELSSLQRVALSNIKDFAVKLEVESNGNKYGFWKFHLTTDQEAGEIIKTKYSFDERKKEEPKAEPVKEVKEPEIEKPSVAERPVEAPEEEIKKTPKEVPVIEEKKEELTKDTLNKLKQELLQELKQKETQTTIKEDPKKKLEGPFYEKLISHFNSKDISVMDGNLVKKDKEFNFTITMPSNVGELKFFIKAVNKAKISDQDVYLAFAEGQHRNLPAILISPGDVSKKGVEQIKKLHGQLIFNKIKI
jgi:hypothetical protein